MKKRGRLRKGLAILLTAAMVVGLVPGMGTIQVSATESDENTVNTVSSNEAMTPDQTDGEATDKLITAWQWIDEEEILDEETGNLALPGANKDNPAYFDDVTAFLPTKIQATVVNAEDTDAESGEEIINLGDWNCEDYPEEGAYSGSYIFTATLPEGYELSEEAKALAVTVELGGAQTYESAEGEIVGDFIVTGDGGYQFDAEERVLIIVGGEITIANTDPTKATTDRIEVWNGENITLAGVNIDVSGLADKAAFKITDYSWENVKITLADNSENTLISGPYCAGLQMSTEYQALTIQGGTNGTGKLTATGGSGGAGIGGGSGGTGSNITITGGTVTATGSAGAGIGGGSGGTGSNITITGGTVTATGGMNGAGIGGGSGGTGSYITITGGTVTATSVEAGAGIGGGSGGTGSNITISDGTVTATSWYGAGIGGGRDSSGSDITIEEGGIVTATSLYGAGIGGGSGGTGSDITIKDGIVTATSSLEGAGIGGGSGGTGSSITIEGGIVTATNEADGAGIGGGSGGTGSKITIRGGTVTATSTHNGAGIGGGNGGTGSNITISGGIVTATGGTNYWNSEIFGGAGIGGGSGGTGSSITISGGSVKAVAGTNANDIGGGSGQSAVTPTSDGTTPVYVFEIANDNGANITINDKVYPKSHSVTEKKIYAYLPAKDVENPNVVTVGAETTKYIYEKSKWFMVPTVTAPVAEHLVYNGSAQELVKAGETTGGKMVYALSKEGDYSETIPTGKDAGTYNVWYQSVDGNTYANIIPSTSVEVSIAKASPVINNAEEVKSQSMVYGSGEFTAPTTGVNGTFEYKIGGNTYNEEALKNYLKTYQVSKSPVVVDYTFKPTDTTNYNDVAGTISITITKATPTISWRMPSSTPWVEINEIPVIYTGSEITPDKLIAPTVTLVNGETYSGEISYSYRVQDSSDEFISGLPTEIGTYEMKASIAANGNYTAAEGTIKLFVTWLNIGNSATLTDQSGNPLTGESWWAQSVTFTPPEGYTICGTVDGTYGASYTYSTETAETGTDVTYYLKNSEGEIAKKTTTVRIDKTAPTWPEDGGISIKTNKWKSLLSTISFGLFYKETVDVTVSASDSLSGVAKYYYYVDTSAGETVKTKEELDALANGEGGFTEYAVADANAAQKITSLSADSSCVVYVYAVDAAGNKSDYICSNGVVIDKAVPIISDISTPSKGSGEDATLTDTKADMTFTASEAGTYFYIVKESSEDAPDAINDFATSLVDESTGMTVWTANEGVTADAMTADDSNRISLTGLTANTAYTVYVIGADQAGNDSNILSQSFTTCKTMPKVATNPTLSGTYGTAVKDMTVTNGVAKAGDTEIDGTWTLTDGDASDVPSVGTTNTYEVTFTPDEKYNGQYDTVLVSVIPTVERKAVTVTAENKSKTYGQENPELTFTVPEGSLVGSDTEEALGVTLSCEATKTSLVTEGGYAITGTSSSANYKVTVTPGILTISQAAAEITVGTESYSKTFGDAAFNLGVTDNNTDEGADVTYAVSDSKNAAGTSVDNEKVITVDASGKVTIVGAGSATITAYLAESNNFTAATSKTITVTVAKKTGYTVADIKKSYLYSRENADTIDLSKYLPANCGMVTYGEPQASGTVEYTVSPAVADGKLSYTVKTGSVGETGTIKVNVGAENYEEFTITVNVKLTDKLLVKLKDGSSVTLQNNILTYGQALSTLSFNSAEFVDDGGNVVTGTLAWKTPDGKPKVGTTSATWVFTPNNEAYEAVEDTVGITVNKATPNVTALPTVAERTYHPTVSLTDTDLVGGTVNVAGSWNWQKANLIPTVNNSGYVAVFTPEDSTNYETVTRAITVTVTKATPYIKTAPTAAAVTYGDTLGASMLSGGTVQYSTSDEITVVGSFTWKDSSVKPSVSDSGTTAYRIVFNPSDAENYNTAETGITLTVNKAENAPNMPSSTMNVANSCTKVSDVTLPTGWVWQDADQNTALTVDTPVTATAVYNGADAGNYVKKTVSVTITRSALNNGGGSSSGGSSGGGNNGGGSNSGGSSSGGNNGGNSSTGGSSGGGNNGGNSSTGGSSGGGTEAGTGDQPENSGNTTTITNEDGSTTTTKTETDTNGNTITTSTTVAADGSSTEKVQATATNTAGKEVAVTTTTKTDADGNVTSVTEKSVIADITKDTTATITVKTGGDGKVTSAKASVTKTSDSTKVSLSGKVLDQITEAAGADVNVRVSMTVKDNDGKTKYTVKADVNEVIPGEKLYIYKLDTKTGKYTMVDNKKYEVTKAGTVTVNMTKKATYELVTAEESKAITKEILATVKPAKKIKSLPVKNTTTFKLSDMLDMDNIKRITYATSKKSVATITKKGTIKAVKVGTATVKATVTLKNGTKKTIKMTIKVK